jgi:hypothetical protein
MVMREVTLDEREGLRIWATMREDDDALVIRGKDTRMNPWGPSDSEYALTVRLADVPKVVAALGGAEGDDVLDIIEMHARDVVVGGERVWLRSIGIEPEFWSNEE